MTHSRLWYIPDVRDATTGRAWTADEACARLVAAIGRMYGAISAAEITDFRGVDGEVITAAKFVREAASIISPSDWPKVRLWAMVRAGVPGMTTSLAEACREKGWSDDTVGRAVTRGTSDLAAGLVLRGKMLTDEPLDRAGKRSAA